MLDEWLVSMVLIMVSFLKGVRVFYIIDTSKRLSLMCLTGCRCFWGSWGRLASGESMIKWFGVAISKFILYILYYLRIGSL